MKITAEYCVKDTLRSGIECSIRTIKGCTPEYLADDIPGVLAALVAAGEITETRKNHYQRITQ